MFSMIWKMTGVTLLYVLLTALIWKRTQGKKMTGPLRLAIGLIYGLCAVLSTHFGVDYSHMMLNVRDMGPLSAGLFFDPVSGIVAGLIGGVERYIAGRFWGVGSYTRIACSVSTCLAGFLAAAMNIFIFKRKKPSAIYAFFMGAVVEVFHMYVVFITHREDMNMAFYVVRTCAPSMILFTGAGMAASSTVLRIYAGEWKNPLRKVREEEIPVSQRFQAWLFAMTFAILLLNQILTFSVQTQTAIQNAENTLAAVSDDIRLTYEKLLQTEDNIDVLAEATALMEARAIAEEANHSGGIDQADGAFLERMRGVFNLLAVAAVDESGAAVASAGDSPVYSALLADVLDGGVEAMAARPSDSRVAAGARCAGGMIQVVLSEDSLAEALNLSGLKETLSFFHVGASGTYDIIRDSGMIPVGVHKGTPVSADDLERIKAQPNQTCFRARLFGVDSLCRTEQLEGGLTLLAQLPMQEVYADRDIQTYESAFAAIILFAVIYVLISMLVQAIVVNNLLLVNQSLDRITNGNLNEVVDVRRSSEFASLSDDINHTVSVLKGYIDAAEKRIEQELEFARRIQDSALPKNFTFPRKDFEIYATMDPAKEVGGDFYDFFFVGQNHLALVIADVSGKGIPAALFMMRAKTAIRGLAESGQSPAQILYRANNTLCEGNEAEMFVTVWLGIIDLATGRMQCANAGHEYPALMRAGGSYEVLRDRHGPALAAMEDMPYREYEVQMNPGDKLFVYTDGVPEAIDEQVEQYGLDRMIVALNAVRDRAMTDTLPAVREHLQAFVGEAEQFDDITMLGLHYIGDGSGQTYELQLEATDENLSRVIAFLDEHLEAMGCPPRTLMQIEVAAEELFVNIAHYAYVPKTGSATVRLSFEPEPRAAVITFIDRGMPYDPLAKPDPDVTLPAEERQIGGLGIYMVKKSVDAIDYRREDGMNILTIRKRIG